MFQCEIYLGITALLCEHLGLPEPAVSWEGAVGVAAWSPLVIPVSAAPQADSYSLLLGGEEVLFHGKGMCHPVPQ